MAAATSSGPGEPPRFVLKIGGKTFDHWVSVELERSIGCYSTVKFTCPFEPSSKDFRDLVRPFSFQPVTLSLSDELLFTGTLIGVDPEEDEDSASVTVTCYARPAIMHDCCPPADAFPLEFDGMDLLQIANIITGHFGFTASIEQPTIARDGSTIDAEFIKRAVRHGKRGGIIGGKGSVFARLSLGPGDDVQEFLAGLAKQRGGVWTDDAQGNLIFWNSVNPGNPVVWLEEGQQPLGKVSPSFNPQGYFSEITAWTPSTRRRKGNQWTEKNPLAEGFTRPHSFKPNDTDGADGPRAARAKLAFMLGNVVTWELPLPGFHDPQGQLFKPNTTLMLLAPRAMVYSPYELLIRDVKFGQTMDESSALLTAVLPGAFNLDFPETFPWDE
jgi:prophage tail gpP-like protein